MKKFLEAGKMDKGGTNSIYQIKERPANPSPMIPEKIGPDCFGGSDFPDFDIDEFGPDVTGSTQTSPGTYVVNKSHSIYYADFDVAVADNLLGNFTATELGCDYVPTAFNPRRLESAVAEPPPKDSEHPAVKDLILRDINRLFGSSRVGGLMRQDVQERAEAGFNTYGKYLRPFNGRNPLMDAYQELIDGAKYLRQALYESPNSVDISRALDEMLLTAYLVRHILYNKVEK